MEFLTRQIHPIFEPVFLTQACKRRREQQNNYIQILRFKKNNQSQESNHFSFLPLDLRSIPRKPDGYSEQSEAPLEEKGKLKRTS